MDMFNPRIEPDFETRIVETKQGAFKLRELSAGFMEGFPELLKKSSQAAYWLALKAACVDPVLDDSARDKITASVWDKLVENIDEMNTEKSEENEKNVPKPPVI